MINVPKSTLLSLHIEIKYDKIKCRIRKKEKEKVNRVNLTVLFVLLEIFLQLLSMMVYFEL